MPVLEEKHAPQLSWSNERLLAQCRKGDQEAWAALVEKYKNLVYSIPLRMGLPEEAPDIFQAVFLELLAELPNLREPQALAKWLIQVCYHKCLRSRALQQRQAAVAIEDIETAAPAGAPSLEEIMIEGQRRQAVCDALPLLSPRCIQLVQKLFYQTPARPYEEVARELGVAKGSIGFIRGRCLAHLRKQLERMGFK